MNGELHGQLYDSGRSATRPATVRRTGPGEIEVRWEDGSSRYRIEAVKASERVGNIPRQLDLPDGRRLALADNDAVDSLLLANARAGWLPLLENRLGYVLLALALSVALFWALIQFGLPAGARIIAERLPPAAATSISEQALNQLDGRLLQPTELPAGDRERLRQRFNQLARESGATQDLRIEFRRGGRALGANAIALPSGLVVMTDELVALAENDDQLVAVMAHEIGHVVHRHGLRQVLQSTALGLVVTYVTGDTASLIGALPVMLTQLGYSREFEREADRYTLDRLCAAGIEPRHFAAILARLADQPGDEAADGRRLSGYLSTHPATDERSAPFLREEAC